MSEFEVVNVESRPMLYVSRQSSMDSDKIGGVMDDAFNAIGRFIGEKSIAPIGPPLAIYSDWDGSRMTIQIGFPVTAGDIEKADGEVHGGETPGGRFLKTVHHGAYPRLRETYAKLERQLKSNHAATPDSSWEVYVSDPDTTPEDQLVTEIYMPLAVDG